MVQGVAPYTRAERLLNLLMALRSTSVGLDRDQIRAQVRGYRADASVEAFERMFERDKDELRSLGIPITTLTDAHGAVTGYRIDGPWELGELDLDPGELAVLSVAARAWQWADLGPAALNALRKVEAALGVPAGPVAAAPVAGLSADSPALLALIAACSQRRPVSFAYRKGSGVGAQVRHVNPWGVVWWRAHWYVVGWDADRSGVRVFRASRISGAVREAGPPGSFEVPEGFDARAAIGRFDRQAGEVIRVIVPQGAAAALRRTGTVVGRCGDGGDLLELRVRDIPTGVAGVLGSASPARVVWPPEARREAARQLDVMLAAHESPAPPAGRLRGPAPTPAAGGAAQAQFARLLALVPWLAANSGVTVARAAEHFGISEEQLLADLSSVITSGPDDWTLFDIQYWENGGVIEVIDALHLDRPLQLAPDEAVALMVALHALAAVPGGHDRGVLDGVLAKLAALLGERAPDPRATAVRVDVADAVLAPVQRALDSGHALELEYLGAVRDEVTHRLVDPIAVLVVDGLAYLRAHCRDAGALRLFRLDRILTAAVSQEPARPRGEAAVPTSVEPMTVTLAASGRRILLDVAPAGEHILDRHPWTRTWSLPEGWVRAEMPVGDWGWARQLVLGSAGLAVLREPAWLREDICSSIRVLRPGDTADDCAQYEPEVTTLLPKVTS